MFELDGHFELFKDAGDDAIFVGFGVLDGDGVVVVHHDDGVAGGPDVEEGLVYYFGERALRIISDSFSKSGVVIATPPELTLAASKRHKSSASS